MNPETTKIYEEKLKEVREAIRALNTLMKSDDDDVILQAVDLYIQLCELELALIHTINEASESQADNPLVRRLRLAT